jgi:hypothetical protein
MNEPYNKSINFAPSAPVIETLLSARSSGTVHRLVPARVKRQDANAHATVLAITPDVSLTGRLPSLTQLRPPPTV